jgi:predicted outer membrane repeat protein
MSLIDRTTSPRPPSVLLKNVTFTHNVAERGAAISAFSRDLEIRGARFEGNEASTSGGAVALGGLASVIDRAWFANNYAAYGGGAVFVNEFSDVTIANSAFWGNMAGVEGGGLRTWGTTVLRNVTFHANRAPEGFGGAIYSCGDLDYHGRAILLNTILWDNPGGELRGTGAGSFGDEPEINCIKGYAASTWSVPCAVGATPFLDPEHGDLRLYPTSPAIDAGYNKSSEGYSLDLDDKARISGTRVDLGAYER